MKYVEQCKIQINKKKRLVEKKTLQLNFQSVSKLFQGREAESSGHTSPVSFVYGMKGW